MMPASNVAEVPYDSEIPSAEQVQRPNGSGRLSGSDPRVLIAAPALQQSRSKRARLGTSGRARNAADLTHGGPRYSKKLIGFKNEWRVRVGDYRVLYVIDDPSKRLIVARVAHRREAYR